jgi:hypothetical protein
MSRVRSVAQVVIAGVVLVVLHDQPSNEASAAGARAAAPPDSSVLRLGGIALDPASVAGGTAVHGTVTLTEPAPPRGAVVTMVSSDPRTAALPANVTVPPGASSATFVVRTSRPPQRTAVEISAHIGNTPPATARLVVMPASGGATSVPSGYDIKDNIKK